MGSYELDENKYLHYTGDGWVTTTRTLTNQEIKDFNKGNIDYMKFEWD